MKNKIIKTLRLGILSIGISLFLTNCEKENSINTSAQQTTQPVVTQSSLQDLMDNPTLKQHLLKTNQDGLLKRNTDDTNTFRFKGNEVLNTLTENETTYSTPIERVSSTNDDEILTLLVKENQEGSSSYILTYSKSLNQTTIQPIQTNTPSSTDEAIEIECITYYWSISYDDNCNCVFNSSNVPSQGSGSVTICTTTSIEASFDPNGGGGSTGNPTGVDNSDAGSTPGGSTSNSTYIPIYIYEGESTPCDNPEILSTVILGAVGGLARTSRE